MTSRAYLRRLNARHTRHLYSLRRINERNWINLAAEPAKIVNHKRDCS